MHELSIAQSMLQIVLEEAERHQVDRVRRVGIKVGAYSAVVPDSLRFCFELISEGTPAQGAELAIEEVPLAGLCRDCGARLDMSQPLFACTECHSARIELTQGQELLVDFIES